MSIQGKKRRFLSREYVLSRISAYDVFYKYMPWKFTINKPCHSPFTDDKHPSCIIGNKFGEVTFKCFNTENRGDCFSFVMQLYTLSFEEALYKIALDFGLLRDSILKPSDLIKYEQPKIIVEPAFIQAVSQPFTEKDKEYLAQYHLTPRDLQFCKDTRANSTLEWSVNRKKQMMKKNEICFYYHLKNERGEWIKIYKPYADKVLKWRSSIPFTEMHGVGNISPGCTTGVVTKSMKDAAFLAKYVLPCVEVVQAEDYTCITPENRKRLKSSCKTLFIAFDCDVRGKDASFKLTKEMDCKHINPPDSLMELGGTDFSDMGKLLGVDAVIQHFKTKKVIL